MKYILLLFLSFIICAASAQSQDVEFSEEMEEDEISRVHFLDVNFSMYAPIDAFSEKIDKSLLYGLSLGYLLQLQKEKPSFIGIEAFHMNLGSFSRDYDAVVGNEQLEVSGRVASNALGINLNYRYYPPIKLSRIEPYVEGSLGVKWMYTYLSESGVFLNDETYESFDILSGEWVLAYGGALGFQIHISDIYYLNLKTAYHFAVSGEYQKKIGENLGFVEFPQEAFEVVQSATNVIKMDIGMTFLF